MTTALTEVFQDVADAIRDKTGETEAMQPTTFAARIANIQVGDKLPEVTEDDNGKILKVIDGTWATGEVESTAPTIFDLSALGLATVVPDGGYVSVETDTTDIKTALANGAVKFKLIANMGEETVFYAVMTSISDDTGAHVCSCMADMGGVAFLLGINVMDNLITVKLSTLDSYIGAYIDTALGGDY